MHDFEMIFILASAIFGPILLVYPIFVRNQKKVKRIRQLAIDHPDQIESLELHEGEDWTLFVTLKGMRSCAIAYNQEAKALHAQLQSRTNTKNQ